MSTLSQFGGNRATKSIVNNQSSGSPAGVTCGVAGQKEVLGGSMTAATLKTLLSISGAGEVPQLTAYTKDTTSRTVRCKVTVDGTVVFDATSAAIVTSGNGLVIAGVPFSSGAVVTTHAPIRFNSSLLVECASSLTETDKVAIGYVAQTF